MIDLSHGFSSRPASGSNANVMIASLVRQAIRPGNASPGRQKSVSKGGTALPARSIIEKPATQEG